MELRSSRATKLKIEQIDLDALTFEALQKEAHSKKLPIPSVLKSELKSAMGERKSGYVFLFRTGGPVRNLRTRIRATRLAAGI